MFESLAEELMDAVIILKSDYNVIYINDSCERIFQFSRNKLRLQQTKITQLFPSLSQESLQKLTNKYNKISLTTFEQLQNDFLVKVKFTKIEDQELIFIIIKEYEFEASMLEKYKKNVFELKDINKNLEEVIKSKTTSLLQQKELIDLIFQKAPLGLVMFNSNGEILEKGSDYFHQVFGQGFSIQVVAKGIDRVFEENFSLWLEQVKIGEVPIGDLMELCPEGFIINQTSFKSLFFPMLSNSKEKFFLMVFFEINNVPKNVQKKYENTIIDSELFVSIYSSFREKFFLTNVNPNDFGAFHELLIDIHSLKGILHLFGFSQEVDFVHRLENRFEPFKLLKTLPEEKFFQQLIQDFKLLDTQISDQIGKYDDNIIYHITYESIQTYLSNLSPIHQRELGTSLFSKSLKDFSRSLSLFLEKECQFRKINCLPLNITNMQFRIPIWSWRRIIPLLSIILRNSIAHGAVFENNLQKWPLEIGISLQELDQTIILKITDNGNGFTFDTSDSHLIDQLSGRKIGLLGLRKEVEKLNGKLELQNLEFGGACCTITLSTNEFFCVDK
jgi:signal transduction histidine kinase